MNQFSPTCLTNRALVKAVGADVTSLLQSLLTCNVQAIEPASAAYGFLLTPQGRFLHELFVMPYEDGFLLDVNMDFPLNAVSRPHSHEHAEHRSMGEPVGEPGNIKNFLKRLKIYTLKSDAHFTLVDNWVVVVSTQRSDNVLAVLDPRHPALGYRMYGAKDNVTLDESQNSYHAHRIALGIPSAEDFVSEKSLLLHYDVDQLGGVDYQKGCYVGQEVTARMHYRNVDKKGLYIVQADDAGAMLSTGSAVMNADDKEAGTVYSVAAGTGIAVLRHDLVGDAMAAGDINITARRPDWVKASEAA